jgi:DNA-binding response OmpR family regulator
MNKDHSERILLAEDYASMRDLISSALRRLGFTNVVAVANGEDAISAFKRGLFHIVMLDIEMPKADGFQVAQAIRELDEDVFIAMVSNHGSKEVISRAMEIGVNDFIVKPLSSKCLLRIIDKYRQTTTS